MLNNSAQPRASGRSKMSTPLDPGSRVGRALYGER
jgi:hypothetical protein